MSIRIKDFQSSIPPEMRCLFDDHYAVMPATTKVVGESRLLDFVASDDGVDLDGEIVAAGAFHEHRDIFMSNSCVLAGHQHHLASGLSPVIGEVLQLHTDKNPMIGRMEFAPDAAGEIVRNHYALYRSGKQKAFSVGFCVQETVKQGRRNIITKGVLLEISAVPVPANSRALALEFIKDTIADYGGVHAHDGHAAEEVAQMVRELEARIKSWEDLAVGGASSDAEARTKGASPGEDKEKEKEIAECMSAWDRTPA